MNKYRFDPAMNAAGAIGLILKAINSLWLDVYASRYIEKMTTDICNVLRLRVYGRENVPKTGACIFGVAPHSSDLDGPVAAVATGRQLLDLAFGVAKDRFYCSPGRAYFSEHIISTIPVERQGFSRSSLVRSREILKTGKGLVILAEGTRQGSNGSDVREFKPGAAALALEIGCPLIPTRIFGAYRVLPLNAKFPRRRGPIIVVFDAPLMPEYFKGMDRHQLTAKLECRVRELKLPTPQRSA